MTAKREEKSAAEITDAERAKAEEFLDYLTGTWEERVEEVAQAFARERKKARAPLLALADEMEHRDAAICRGMAAQAEGQRNLSAEVIFSLQAADLLSAADRIRKAAGRDGES